MRKRAFVLAALFLLSLLLCACAHKQKEDGSASDNTVYEDPSLYGATAPETREENGAYNDGRGFVPTEEDELPIDLFN